MESQAQQLADNTSDSSGTTTALEPQARQIISPTTQSIVKVTQKLEGVLKQQD